MKTDLERKLFLASKLPELIVLHDGNYHWLSRPLGKYASEKVTGREWDCVVREVEHQLGANLIEQTEVMFNPPFNMSIEEIRAATWQQRTDALMEMEMETNL